MSIGNMHHKRLPLCQYKSLEALFSARGTPIYMSSDTFHPLGNSFITLRFASLQHFFSDGSGNMPDIIKMAGLGLVFSDPFSDAQVPVRNEDRNCKSCQIDR
jgi:hypothetical protein